MKDSDKHVPLWQGILAGLAAVFIFWLIALADHIDDGAEFGLGMLAISGAGCGIWFLISIANLFQRIFSRQE